MFASNRVFSGTGYRMMSVKFYNNHPGSHGNKSWDKIGYNSAYMRDIAEFFASNGGFLGLTIEWCQTNSTTTNPRCHGNEI